MPFVKGRAKDPNSGRRKGVKTKVVALHIAPTVQERLEQLGCDPIEGLVEIATNKKYGVGVRARCLAELAQFVYPKRKAIEHIGLVGDTINVNLGARESFETRIAGVRARLGIAEPARLDGPGCITVDPDGLAMEREAVTTPTGHTGIAEP
jgi:hypothetical protein